MAEIFYSIVRAALKGRSLLPSDTLRYIQALELVAKRAVLLWSVMRSDDQKAKEKAANALRDALEVVDFMNE